jgi:hypothetical protein
MPASYGQCSIILAGDSSILAYNCSVMFFEVVCADESKYGKIKMLIDIKMMNFFMLREFNLL